MKSDKKKEKHITNWTGLGSGMKRKRQHENGIEHKDPLSQTLLFSLTFLLLLLFRSLFSLHFDSMFFHFFFFFFICKNFIIFIYFVYNFAFNLSVLSILCESRVCATRHFVLSVFVSSFSVRSLFTRFKHVKRIRKIWIMIQQWWRTCLPLCFSCAQFETGIFNFKCKIHFLSFFSGCFRRLISVNVLAKLASDECR